MNDETDDKKIYDDDKRIYVAVTYNNINPLNISYESVVAIKTVKIDGYWFCLHNNYNPLMQGCSFSEYYTGRNIKSYNNTLTGDADSDLNNSIERDFEYFIKNKPEGFIDEKTQAMAIVNKF